MRVMFSVGESSKKVINTLNKSADDVQFFCYPTIKEMIKESTLRQLYFDRIVFSEKILSNPEEELQALNDYIVNYSDSSTVVIIVNADKPGVDKVFLEYFNSPLYTPVLLKKIGVTVLLEVVTSDITELRAKYYTLDVKEVKAEVSSYVSNKEEDVKVTESKPKKGFLGSLFGGKRNDTENPESNLSVPEEKNTPENTGDSVLNSAYDFSDMDEGESVVKDSEVKEEGNSPQEDFVEKDDIISEDSSLNANSNFEGQEDENNIDDLDDLSLGEYGSAHSDTDFFDEETEKELEELISSTEGENVKEAEEVPGIVEEKAVVEEVNSVNIPKEGKVLLVTGENGVGVTSYIVDTSVGLVNEGKSVLIVDLDEDNNGVLSYINTEKFYTNKCSLGIVNKEFYEEDGVHVVSNGYGSRVDISDLLNLLNSAFCRKYDKIFLDCPLGFLKKFKSENLEDFCSDITLIAGGNIGSMISTSLGITCDDISLKNKEFLAKGRVVIVNNSKYFDEDLEKVKELGYFPYGCWLNNIE